MTEPTGGPEGKSAYVLSQLYYYVVAVIGVGLLIGGGVAALFGLRAIVFPRELETVRDGIRTLLFGAAFALPGIALLWTHLREARRREGGPFTEAFWGSSLYYYLVAVISLVFVLIGTIGILASFVDLAVSPCPASRGGDIVGWCGPEEVGRRIVDFAIFLVVGGPVFWWHLRQGRRLTGPAQPDPE